MRQLTRTYPIDLERAVEAPETERMSFDTLLRGAEKVLTERFGRHVRVGPAELLKQWNRSYVLRCSVISETGDLPLSVVVKQIKQQGDCGYDDWAGVQFLSGVEGEPPFGPRFLGGDERAGFFIMEDLGAGTTLEDLLLGTDRTAAEGALLGLAAVAGRMHAATRGREEEYARLRASRAPIGTATRTRNAKTLREALPAVREAFERVDVKPVAGFEEEYEQVASRIEQPGPWLTYTHGDMAPSNNHYVGATPRLLDFEYGAFRHALYDAIFWRIICPFPKAIALRMDDVYRAEAARAIREAGDDRSFARALAELCAYDVFANIRWHFRHALDADRTWAGDYTVRQALLYKLERFAELCGTGNLEALGASADRLGARLKLAWPAAGEVHMWPVFGTTRPPA